MGELVTRGEGSGKGHNTGLRNSTIQETGEKIKKSTEKHPGGSAQNQRVDSKPLLTRWRKKTLSRRRWSIFRAGAKEGKNSTNLRVLEWPTRFLTYPSRGGKGGSIKKKEKKGGWKGRTRTLKPQKRKKKTRRKGREKYNS